ncbi:MAG TPA: hypothetical protein VFW45_15420 [Candidatus Polarisedimenticolia bacterium]|nr:hypothetical protein [Candidatus Polarisedimenticolia bacterium]
MARGKDGNAHWLGERALPGAIILIGGASLSDFRMRVAQSHLRHDLLPSFWSMAGLADSKRSFLTVPLSAGGDSSDIPSSNGIRRVPFQQVDDQGRFPNVAVINFTEPSAGIVSNIRKLTTRRHALDLPSMMLPWLAFLWGAGSKANPLNDGQGTPGAALVETAFGMAGIELTPGLTSTASCPEAIWQSALWWHDYYAKTADQGGTRVATELGVKGSSAKVKAIVPQGQYRLGQVAAAVTWEKSQN